MQRNLQNPTQKDANEIEMDKLIMDESPQQAEMFEINDPRPGDSSEPNLVKIEREETQRTLQKETTWMKIKKICLFQVFGYKGTLIHIVAIYLLLLGFIGGTMGATMDICIDQINTLRKWLLQLYDASYYRIIVWILFTTFGGTCAFLFTKYVSPQAGGSGVPEMKVTLLGNFFPNFLSMRTLIAKVFGLVLAIGSGLWCGKVGPSIHICGCIATQLTHLPLFQFLRKHDELFTQMLAIGAGCGVASTFGCPIGGLLFSVEVTATYFQVRNYWFSIFTSVLCAFSFRAITNIYRDREGLFTGILAIGYTFEYPGIREVLIAIIMGLIIGVFAVLFVNATGSVFVAKEYLKKYYLGRMPYLYFIVICTLTAVVTAPWQEKYNGFGYLGNATIAQLFSNQSVESIYGPHYLIVLAIYFIARYTITSFSISYPVPVGLFSTNVVVGAVLGRLIGEIMENIGIENTYGPGGMAILGGAFFVTSITQTFSATIVILEAIDNYQLLIPILIGAVVTISTSRFFTEGIYDKIAISKKLPYMPDIQYSIHQTAEMVMETDLVAVSEYSGIEELKGIVEHFKKVKERNIPVINSRQGRILLGQMKLSDIRNVVSSLEDKETNEFLLNFKECSLVLLRHTPLSQVHMLFIAAQIEAAFVTHNGRLVGEITKKCLNETFKRQMTILF